MVLGLLIVTAIPAVTGVAEAISSQKQQNAQMKEKIKFNMTATLSVNGGPPTEAWVVLHGGRMYVDHPDAPRPGHKFNGYYFKYPAEPGYQGLVSTISDDPPMLNWLYVDKDTGAVRYGARKETIGHVIGPWGWSEDEQFLTIDGDDWRFIAVEEDSPVPEKSAEEGQDANNNNGGGGGGGGDNEAEGAGKCWAVYLSRDQDGSLKPKAERKKMTQQRDGSGEHEDVDEEEEEDDEEDGPDVRYTHKWAAIRLLRKLQLGVDSSWVKGQRGQSGNS